MKQKSGFSLMEMMIVLLIVSILAAVAAPMVNKKMVRSAGTTSPWNWSGIVGNSIWYDRGDNNMVIIGDSTPPAQNRGGKLYIKSDRARQPQISLSRGDVESLKLAYDENSVWMSTVAPNANATGVVIGTGADANSSDAVSIGSNSSARGRAAIAIGGEDGVVAGANYSIAIGNHTSADAVSSLAIGDGATAAGQQSIAIGDNTRSNTSAVALGSNTSSDQTSSIAIGNNAFARAQSAIVIGSGDARSTSANSVTIGVGAMTGAQDRGIAIGNLAGSNSQNGIAIGTSSNAVTGNNCIAIGNSAQSRNSGIKIGTGNASSGALGTNAIAIGNNAHSGQTNGVAVGNTANAGGSNSLALGFNTTANNNNSIALGQGVSTDRTNQLMIGNGTSNYTLDCPANQLTIGHSSGTVYVPGKLKVDTLEIENLYVPGTLVVDKSCVLCRTGGEFIFRAQPGPPSESTKYKTSELSRIFMGDDKGGDDNTRTLRKYGWTYNIGGFHISSDRKLKNVGEVFTGGLEQIKQIKPFNYTFKDDKTKTPLVGVMAQDLQKIFPNAVIKGEDGFLRIRTEEILYSLVNAVKELDAKITALVQDNQKEIKALRGEVNSLKKENAELLKRLEALEKKIK